MRTRQGVAVCNWCSQLRLMLARTPEPVASGGKRVSSASSLPQIKQNFSSDFKTGNQGTRALPFRRNPTPYNIAWKEELWTNGDSTSRSMCLGILRAGGSDRRNVSSHTVHE